MDKLLVRLNTPVVVGQRQAIPVKQLGEGAYSVVFACRTRANAYARSLRHGLGNSK